MYVNSRPFHFNVWQNSLQIKKIKNKKKEKKKAKKKKKRKRNVSKCKEHYACIFKYSLWLIFHRIPLSFTKGKERLILSEVKSLTNNAENYHNKMLQLS